MTTKFTFIFHYMGASGEGLTMIRVLVNYCVGARNYLSQHNIKRMLWNNKDKGSPMIFLSDSFFAMIFRQQYKKENNLMHARLRQFPFE